MSWTDALDIELIHSSMTLGTRLLSLPLFCVLLDVFMLYVVICNMLAHI